jgi:hypothetical protein
VTLSFLFSFKGQNFARKMASVFASTLLKVPKTKFYLYICRSSFWVCPVVSVLRWLPHFLLSRLAVLCPLSWDSCPAMAVMWRLSSRVQWFWKLNHPNPKMKNIGSIQHEFKYHPFYFRVFVSAFVFESIFKNHFRLIKIDTFLNVVFSFSALKLMYFTIPSNWIV